MPYPEDVEFFKTGLSRQHKQPEHSWVALEGQECTVKTKKDQIHYPGAHRGTPHYH